MFSLAVSWSWLDIAVYLLICFTGMLRPGEALKLTRADVLLPVDLMTNRRSCFLRVRDPKNRRIAARREHVRIDDYMVVDLLEVWLPDVNHPSVCLLSTPRRYANLMITLYPYLAFQPWTALVSHLRRIAEPEQL